MFDGAVIIAFVFVDPSKEIEKASIKLDPITKRKRTGQISLSQLIHPSLQLIPQGQLSQQTKKNKSCFLLLTYICTLFRKWIDSILFHKGADIYCIPLGKDLRILIASLCH